MLNVEYECIIIIKLNILSIFSNPQTNRNHIEISDTEHSALSKCYRNNINIEIMYRNNISIYMFNLIHINASKNIIKIVNLICIEIILNYNSKYDNTLLT